MTTTLVCGRGESLKTYVNYLDSKIDYIYLVNEFDKFISQDSNLLEFFKKKSSEGTKIILLINAEMKGLNRYLLSNININEVFSTRLRYTEEKVWWREHYDANRFLKTLNVIVKPQPESMSQHMNKVGNSLHVALIHAVIENKSKNVHVIGKDFYESFYFLDEDDNWSSSRWPNENTPKTQNRLKKEFTEIVKSFPSVNFTISTQSSYNCNLQNCEVIKV